MSTNSSKRELLALVGHRPAHEREVVEERLREEAGAAVEVQAHRVLALRDLRAVGVAQQRQVAEDGRLPAEALVEPHVLRQRREPLLGADHVRDAHQVVVDHVGEVIGRKAVALEQDLVVHLRVVDRDVAAEQVVDDALALARHREADDVRLARLPAPGRPRPAQCRGSGRRSRSSASSPSAPRAAPPAARASRSTVGRPALHELRRVLAVDGAPLALAVGRVRARPCPAPRPTRGRATERLEDHGLARGGAALAVGVLDAQDELAAVFAGERVVEERDVRGAHVRIARGARGYARPDRHGTVEAITRPAAAQACA